MTETFSGQGFDPRAFQAQLGNVAAVNQFVVSITPPTALANSLPQLQGFNNKIQFAAQASSVPEWTIGVIDVPFRGGYKARIPGDRSRTATWPCTCRLDVDGSIQGTLEAWHDAMVGFIENDTAGADDDVTSLMGVGDLWQLSRNSRVLRHWQFAGAWPMTLGAMSFSWSQDNTVLNLDTTWVFQHTESDTIRNSNAALFTGA